MHQPAKADFGLIEKIVLPVVVSVESYIPLNKAQHGVFFAEQFALRTQRNKLGPFAGNIFQGAEELKVALIDVVHVAAKGTRYRHGFVGCL